MNLKTGMSVSLSIPFSESLVVRDSKGRFSKAQEKQIVNGVEQLVSVGGTKKTQMLLERLRTIGSAR